MVNNGQQESQKMIKKSTAKNPKVRAKEYGLVVRKLDNRPNAPYQTDYYANGKRIRRSFKTYEEAVEDYERYISTIGKAQNVLWNRNLSIEQVADVNTALNMLPQGKSLVDAVKCLLGTIQTLPLVDSLYEFRKSKEKCSLDHVRHVKIITKKFLERFNEWIDINDKTFLEWLLQRGQPKTIYHSYTLMSEFFAYAVRRGHISKHPASNVVSSDLPKVKVKPPKFFTIDETKEILSYMQKRHPHYTLWFAIGFFTGI
jgi:integrase